MSAVLAAAAAASAHFEFHGAAVSLSCASPDELRKALSTFGIGAEAANDAGGTPTGKPTKPAATAPAGKPASQTTASSAQSAAAPAAQGDAGNATLQAGQPAAASTASSTKESDAAALPEDPKKAFDVLKKAFLGLSTKADGRAKCEGVLKPFGLTRLSEADPVQYAAVLAEIEKASA